MKKILCGLLACALFMTALAGCSKSAPSDTVKWFNATYAILTTANEADVNEIGGYKKNSVNEVLVQAVLEDSWGVTDRATADETLDWILTDGHRITFQDDMASLEELGFFELTDSDAKEVFVEMGFTDDEAACYVAAMETYRQGGEHAIDAWDYCRALQLLSWYYLAGYYTESEAMDKSLEIAKELQNLYISWDELAESYLKGYNYWSEDDPEDPNSATAARRQVYETLRDGENSPYSLAWNTTLEKTWE